MYWILTIMAAIAALIIALVVGGLVTPREYRAIRQITVARPGHAVVALLEQIDRYDRWVGAPLSIAHTPVAAAGVGHTPATRDIEHENAHHFALDVTDDDTGVQRTWRWTVRDASASDPFTGTSIRLEERGAIGNPIVRFFASFRGHAGTVERTLEALARHLGEHEVAIERDAS
jgi:hypothetical protein